jgi:hypothetical protein
VRWRRAAEALARAVALLDPRARRGAIYEIVVAHPDHGRDWCGYIGKTRQQVPARVGQHLATKPWARAYRRHRTVWSSHHVTNMGLFLREVWTILTRRPIFNHQWNRANPDRIPIPRQWDIYNRVGRCPGNPPTRPVARYGARRPAGHPRAARHRTPVR